MPDGLTNNYSLLLQTQGGDIGTWGTGLNNGDLTPIDAALAGNYTATITVSDVTLTTTQFQNAIFSLTGSLTGNRSFIVPFSPNSATTPVSGRFIVVNNCTGAFNITVKTPATGSIGVTAPVGQPVLLYSDATNVNYAVLGNPATVAAASGNPTGQLAGTAGSVNTNATLAADYTNAALYLCTQSGTAASAVFSNVAGNPGFDSAQNLQLSASVNSNILTVSALAANTATTPAVGSPIIIPFENATLTSGAPSRVSVTGSLTVATIVGASLGAPSGSLPFRFWIVALNNSGTVSLGLINCSQVNGTTTSLTSVNEGTLRSSTGMTSGATSAGVIYTPNSITLANCPVKIVGYLEYSGGLVTAGTYNTSPTALRLFGPGVKQPGETIQSISNITTNVGTVAALAMTPLSGGQTVAITPTSPINVIRVVSQGPLGSGSADGKARMQVSHKIGGVETLIGYQTQAYLAVASANPTIPVGFTLYDAPYTTAPVTYGFQAFNDVGTTISYPSSDAGGNGAYLEVQEMMG